MSDCRLDDSHHPVGRATLGPRDRDHGPRAPDATGKVRFVDRFTRGPESVGEIEFVLFDLGGVLVELRGIASMKELSGIADEDELWNRWLECRWVRIFESGGCSPEEFSRGVVDDWGLGVEPAEFLDVFAGWPTGPMDGAEELVTDLATRVDVGCLTNTNALHWDGRVELWPLMAHFDPCFLSHRLGLVKPDRDLFLSVAGTLGIEPVRVLFLDDNLVNVESARTVGFQGLRVRGIAETRRALVDRGLVTESAT